MRKLTSHFNLIQIVIPASWKNSSNWNFPWENWIFPHFWVHNLQFIWLFSSADNNQAALIWGVTRKVTRRRQGGGGTDRGKTTWRLENQGIRDSRIGLTPELTPGFVILMASAAKGFSICRRGFTENRLTLARPPGRSRGSETRPLELYY